MASSAIIRPGETGSITMEFDSSEYEGIVDKTAWVYTNDPEAEKIVIRVRAFVEKR